MISLSPTYDTTYTIADPATRLSLAIAGLTTQVPLCGYDQEFTMTAVPAISSPATFLMSTDSNNIFLDLYSRSLVDVGDHTITLNSTLIDYNPYTGADAPTASDEFTLTAVNPCWHTEITADPEQIENFISFAGFNTTSLLKYTFNDTVSVSKTLTTDSVDFCGD